MLNRKGRSQYGSPLWLQSLDQGASGKPLHRLTFSSQNGLPGLQYSETWLQRLLYSHPETLPIMELEPGLGELVPVGLEMQTPAGYVDNVFVTRTGNIVLAECKLWRNPAARRLVIAQIIDYAQSMWRWEYQDFEAAACESKDAEGKPVGRRLIDLVSQDTGEPDGLDESAFHDALQRNLRLGRMLLLVAGDGIREYTEGLADFLQMHAGFHFTLALVEIAVFSGPENGFIVQPRTLARTLNIERAVVRLASDAIIAEQTDSAKPVSAGTISDDIFFENLHKAAPETALLLKTFIAEAAGRGVFLDPATKSASLKWEPD